MFEEEKEDRLLKKRYSELADKSQYNSQFTFTSFLGMAELNLFYEWAEQNHFQEYSVFGGDENCERQMVRFGTSEELGYETPFPIICLEIKPLLKKFADDFEHRDFLGALMNLGIERSTLGDIFVQDHVGYLFCTQTIAPYIIENMDKVKHTHVKTAVCNQWQTYIAKEPEVKEYIVSSERVDGLIAKVYQLSRTQSIRLFGEKKIFVNGKIFENNSGKLKENDVITVRGFGKFIYMGMKYETKKGKYCVSVGKY